MMKNKKVKRRKGLRIQRIDYQERIDNFVLVVGMYSHDPCAPIAN